MKPSIQTKKIIHFLIGIRDQPFKLLFNVLEEA